MRGHARGLWRLTCWNGLSTEQQERLLTIGNLPIGYTPGGPCLNPAQVGVETSEDEAPAPRFFCFDCAIEYITQVRRGKWPTLNYN